MNNPKKISVISCYHDPKKYEALRESLYEQTENYELIGVDNTKNDYSITTAYNKGASLAKGDILCFIHEDVTILTSKWDVAITQFFEAHPEAGFVGVAGGRFASDTPSNWTAYQPQTYLVHCGKMHNTLKKDYSEVILLDGVLLACKASILDTIKFDDNLKGFHGYDYDICLKATELGFKNYVSNNVLITHSSRGNRNRPYAEARLLVYANHRNNLPLFASDIPESQKESIQQSVSYKQLKRTVRLLIRTGYSDKEVVSFIEEWNKYAKGLMKISPKLYIALMKTIVFFIRKT